PVFTEADAVMREDEDASELAQRRETNRWPRVVGEHEEGAAVRVDATMRSHAVERRRHTVLAHPKVDIAPAGFGSAHRAFPLQLGVVRRSEVRGTADQCRQAI